jgi:hypothetical protein
MELLFAVILLGVVVAIVAAPFRRGGNAEPERQSEVEAAEVGKDAKYREILDAELDFHTGKLSKPDYEAIDRALRAEAIELQHRLQAARRKERSG